MKKMKRIKNKLLQLGIGISMISGTIRHAYAISDPVQGVNNLNVLLISLISAVGGIILLWSLVNLGLAIKRRDPAATSEAILGIVGGLIIATGPWIVKMITG